MCNSWRFYLVLHPGIPIIRTIADVISTNPELRRVDLANDVSNNHDEMVGTRTLVLLWSLLLLLGAGVTPLAAQPTPKESTSEAEHLKSTAVLTIDSTLRVHVRNIDITRFPNVGIIFDVFDRDYRFIDTLRKEHIEIEENGDAQEVIDLSLIASTNRVPVDFVFVVDHTGSMRDQIDAVKANIDAFTQKLASKGIDYRLGLVVFDDNVAARHWMTDDIEEFKSWIDVIETSGGGDRPENALEGLRAATGMNFRSSANRVAILVTDAPFHRYNDKRGFGRTRYTERTISVLLERADIRVFNIVDPSISGYWEISERTGGRLFDIKKPFADILDDFVETMTSLYTATYRSHSYMIPDSIEVELRIPSTGKTARKRFSVLEVGRKLVMENIHFSSSRHNIEPDSEPELDYLVRLMLARPRMHIKIEGHTDSIGSYYYNLELSRKRAEAVKLYMVRKGVEQNRLFTIGYGEARPTESNETEAGRRRNRRTEFVILQK